MNPVLKDTVGLGIFFWVIGFLASMVLYYTQWAHVMGWIILCTFTPVSLLITWWWFKGREHLTLQYYAGVGIVWMVLAIVLDYLFIVTLFSATSYYAPDVVLYYALMFIIPVATGLYLNHA
jgi:hypothetical protein